MKIGQNTRGGSNVGLRFNGAHMLGNTPEFAAHLQDMGIQDVAVIEAAFMIEDEPAANLRQFGCRKVVQHSLGNQLDKKDTGGVEDTAQQAPFQRQSIALIDIVKCAQGEDRAALRQRLRRQLRRQLGDQGKSNAVFAPFPSEPVDRSASRREPDAGGCRGVAVGLLAYQQDRRHLLSLGPHGEIKGQPAQQGDHDIGDLNRNAG